jgi:hypothetical protein
MSQDSGQFARALGDALSEFLDGKQISFTDAARQIGLGQEGKARISAYCHDSPKGKRPVPNAELLYLLCSKLGFGFEYGGYKISAETLNGRPRKPPEGPIEQLRIAFDGQFNLTQREGLFSMGVKRPPGRIEVSLSLKETKEVGQ